MVDVFGLGAQDPYILSDDTPAKWLKNKANQPPERRKPIGDDGVDLCLLIRYRCALGSDDEMAPGSEGIVYLAN